MKLKLTLLLLLIPLIKINPTAFEKPTDKLPKTYLQKFAAFSQFLKENIYKGFKVCSSTAKPDCFEEHILDRNYCEKCYNKIPTVERAFLEDNLSLEPCLKLPGQYNLDKARFITPKIFPLFLTIANKIKSPDENTLFFCKKYIFSIFSELTKYNHKGIIEILTSNKNKKVIIPIGTETHTAILFFDGISKNPTIYIIDPAGLNPDGESKYLNFNYMKKELSTIVNKESIFFYPISLMRNNSYTCTLMSAIIEFILYLSEGNIDALNTFLYLYNKAEIKTFEDFFNPKNLDFILGNKNKNHMHRDALIAINSEHSEKFELSMPEGIFFIYALVDSENSNNEISLSIKGLNLTKEGFDAELQSIDAIILFLEKSLEKIKKSLLDDDNIKLPKPTIHNYKDVINNYNKLSREDKIYHRELIKAAYLLQFLCEYLKDKIEAIKKSNSSKIPQKIIKLIKYKLTDLFQKQQENFLEKIYNFYAKNKNILNFKLKNPISENTIKPIIYSWPCYY
jgi:hypothetical protein